MFKVLILCLALGLVPYAANADPLNGQNADDLDVVPDAGHQLPASEPTNLELAVNTKGYVFPFFKNWKSIDEDLLLKFKTEFEAAMLHLDRVVSQSLVPVVGEARIKKRNMMHDLHAKKIAQTLRSIRSPNLIPFVKMCSEFFHRLLKNAKVIERQLEAAQQPRDEVQLRNDIHKRILELNSIHNQSPVALFFDWENGLMDGKSAEKSLSKLMGRLRYHGHKKILTIVETFLSFILNVSRLG